MSTQIEAERKYALAPGQVLPSLATVAVPGEVSQFTMEATYYDAPDLRLLRAHEVIRRRVGGADEGWHLKLRGAGPDQRIEVHAPLASRRLPVALRERVADTLDGAPVAPVAVLRTRRTEQQLCGPDGTLLAVTCVDHVQARVGDHVEEWDEAEVELGAGGVELLERVEAVLRAAGIVRAEAASKIGRALAPVLAAAERPDPSAGGAVLAYLAEQIGVLQNREAGVRTDEPDAVHRSRVATRRLRSALRTYAGVFAPGAYRALRTELRWHAEELGAPRDAEVLRERLLAAVAELEAPGREQVADRVAASLAEAHARAHAELVETMATERYERLQIGLETLLSEPRRADAAIEPAEDVLPAMFDRAVARVRKLAAHAAARPGDLTRWHEVRKAAKAARYGAELLVPVFGDRADADRARWEAVTEAFGAVQDAVVAQQVIGDLAWHAVADGLPRLPFDDLRHAQDRLLRESLARGREELGLALAGDAQAASAPAPF
nr:CYTH and CHAD domain-containing protein [Propionicimonas sp.]